MGIEDFLDNQGRGNEEDKIEKNTSRPKENKSNDFSPSPEGDSSHASISGIDFGEPVGDVFGLNTAVHATHALDLQFELLTQMYQGLEHICGNLDLLRIDLNQRVTEYASLTTKEAASDLAFLYSMIEGEAKLLARKVSSVDMKETLDLMMDLIKLQGEHGKR